MSEPQSSYGDVNQELRDENARLREAINEHRRIATSDLVSMAESYEETQGDLGDWASEWERRNDEKLWAALGDTPDE